MEALTCTSASCVQDSSGFQGVSTMPASVPAAAPSAPVASRTVRLWITSLLLPASTGGELKVENSAELVRLSGM